eukprot:GHVR01032479.1.p1 GENE.GHVR01032479.1~~GHVR01032479.1.p1  ORF type:complete len:153 (-),score=37.79 GHVR01032479.1:136-594(-)
MSTITETPKHQPQNILTQTHTHTAPSPIENNDDLPQNTHIHTITQTPTHQADHNINTEDIPIPHTSTIHRSSSNTFTHKNTTTHVHLHHSMKQMFHSYNDTTANIITDISSTSINNTALFNITHPTYTDEYTLSKTRKFKQIYIDLFFFKIV